MLLFIHITFPCGCINDTTACYYSYALPFLTSTLKVLGVVGHHYALLVNIESTGTHSTGACESSWCIAVDWSAPEGGSVNDEMDKVMFSLVHAEAGKGDTHGQV